MKKIILREGLYFLLFLSIGLVMLPALGTLIQPKELKYFFPPNEPMTNWVITGLLPYAFFQFIRSILWARKQPHKYLLITFVISIAINLYFLAWIFTPKKVYITSVQTAPPEGVTRVRTETIKSLILDYKTYKDRLPQNEEEVNRLIIADSICRRVLFREDDFNTPLQEGLHYFDGWGNQFRYIYVRNKQGEEAFMIYSYGPDGTDEKGHDDDVYYSEYVCWSEKDNRFIIDEETKNSGIPIHQYSKRYPWSKEYKSE